MTDREYMALAAAEAKKAPVHGDVPVGAVIIKDGAVLCAAHNRREEKKNVLGHAEIAALDEACSLLGSKDLSGCEIFVTLEPCPMCAGAIFQSGVDRLVFGAYDEEAGAVVSRADYASVFGIRRTRVVGGLCRKECAALLKDFFGDLREKANAAEREQADGRPADL